MTATDEVPIIDIGPFLSGSEDGKAQVGAAVDRACRDIGFFQIVGHGVPTGEVDAVYSAARSFFALPDADKEEAAQPAPDQVRGWSGVGKEGLSYSLDEAAPGDLKEKMDMGPPGVDRSDPYFTGEAAGPHFAPNVWPTTVPGLRDAWETYFATMSELARQLMMMFAVGLGLPEAFFDDKIDRHISMLRALHYPNQPEPPLPGQLRAGAHSDYGSLTIVRQEDRPGGLQVMARSGEWTDVPVVPNGFVVNIGDLMAEWTNDRWVSTLHRVVNPPRERADDADRVSIVFFHQPNYDAVIECLPTVLEPGEAPKYEPISSGDHLYQKFVKQTSMGAA
ncbi:MAG: 2-oxoglutarate and iron-dependent oxygenase domain-containing protein [Actinomycetota bacterium]